METVRIQQEHAMQQVHVDNLRGNEVLGMPVVSSGNVILISEGTVLSEEYIKKLRELDIQDVYIRKNGADENRVYSIDETYSESKRNIENVLEKHIYKHNSDLQKVAVEAVRIMDSVIEKPEVVNGLTEIRNISTDMYSHCINVCSMSTILAIRLKMTETQVHDIAMGAILHDIGLKYIRVPYINVDVEDMSPKNQMEYKKHTIYGYSALQDETWLSDTAKDIILMHHEREDGNGYPFQNSRFRVSQEVKLVAVCDDFDAMISGIGRRKMKIYEAIEYIKVNAGIIYERSVASKLLKTMAVYPVGTRVLTSDGEIGVVEKQNSEAPERPVIKILKGADGHDYEKPDFKDLMKILTLFIVDTID